MKPFQQTAALIGQTEPLDPPETELLRREMQVLLALQNESAFLAHVRQTLPTLLSYPSVILHRYVSLVFEAAGQCLQIDPADYTAACTALLARIPVMTSVAQCASSLEASLKELWLSSSQAGGSSLCGRIAQYLHANLQQPVSLTDLADCFGYTTSYVNRIFKKEYDTSPMQYLTDLRITRAKELLQHTPDLNIRAVAQSVGYEDARYFSRVFKNETGLTPSAWVEKHHFQE